MSSTKVTNANNSESVYEDHGTLVAVTTASGKVYCLEGTYESYGAEGVSSEYLYELARAKPVLNTDSTKVPSAVLSAVQMCINNLNRYNDAINQAKQTDIMFQGNGRYESEVREKLSHPNSKTIRDFCIFAPNHGLDGEAIIRQLGYRG